MLITVFLHLTLQQYPEELDAAALLVQRWSQHFVGSIPAEGYCPGVALTRPAPLDDAFSHGSENFGACTCYLPMLDYFCRHLKAGHLQASAVRRCNDELNMR